MRYARQNMILDLINSCEIETQEKLAEMLHGKGFKVTQATVSRDIKELQLTKTATPSGRSKYTVGSAASQPSSERFVKIFRETVQSVAYSGNIVVIKTLPGCANAAAEAIDSLHFQHILGSIAGDNTVMLIIDDISNIGDAVAKFNEMTR